MNNVRAERGFILLEMMNALSSEAHRQEINVFSKLKRAFVSSIHINLLREELALVSQFQVSGNAWKHEANQGLDFHEGINVAHRPFILVV